MEAHKGKGGIEKSIQQGIVSSNSLSEYLLTDFEYQKGSDARFDLMGVKLCDNRPMLSFIELKQKYTSLRTTLKNDGTFTSGLKKHLEDILGVIQGKGKENENDPPNPEEMIRKEILQTRTLYNQKSELGLFPDLSFPESVCADEIEVLFVLADFISGGSTRVSTYLIDELNDIEEFINKKQINFKLNVNLMFLKIEKDGFKVVDHSDIANLKNWKSVLTDFYNGRNFYYQYLGEGEPRHPLIEAPDKTMARKGTNER